MRVRHKARAALGAAIVVAAGAWIGTSAGGATGGETSANEDALPSVIARMIADPASATAGYELQASQARHVNLRTGGSVWVLPGRTGGACLFRPDGGGSCANADQIARGLLVLGTPAAGSANFIGYAPGGVTTIRLVDGDGSVVDELTPQEGTRVYGFRQTRELGRSVPAKVIFADASGEALSTWPVPGGGP
jgi:hypothetical protein